MNFPKASVGKSRFTISLWQSMFMTDPVSGTRYEVTRTGVSIHRPDGSVSGNYCYSPAKEVA